MLNPCGWCLRQDFTVVSGQLVQLMADNVGQHSDEWTEYVLRDPILFGDYRNALESDVPRLYEDMQDYDASKALFQEVKFSCPSIDFPIRLNIVF